MYNDNNGLPFALIRWIKAQQEKDRQHEEYMSRKNAVDSAEFMFYLTAIAESQCTLTKSELQLIHSFTLHYDRTNNFTPKQRSVIGNLYVKYILKA